MKLRPRRPKASESPVRKAKLRMPFKTQKNTGPSRRSCSRRQVSIVSTSSVSNIEIGPGSGIAQLLEEVLLHILGFLTFADVKSARLVNKHWRQVSTTRLRRSSKEIKLNSRIVECITKLGDGQFPVNRMEVSLRHPIENRKIRSAYFPGICAWVKELTLSVDIDNRSPVWLPEDIVTFPTDCVYKDLTHFNLQINQRTDLSQESWNRFTEFVRTILKQSPILREVNVGYQVGTSKLSCINFEGVPLGKIDLAKWSTLTLKLSKLELNVSCFSNTNNLLTDFLETQTGTLKHLTLKQRRWDSEAPAGSFTFPRLEKLEELRVTCNYFYPVVTFPGIDYTRLFPSLKKLDLTYGYANWRDFLGNNLLEPTNTVEELIFPWTLRNAVPNPAVIAGNVFTGLKKLKIDPDPFMIEAVFENMPNLEVLYFSDLGAYDAIITGLEREVCSRFRGVMTKEWIEELENAEGRSMARLQNLKTLKLSNGVRMYDDDDRLYISRLSLHVFKKMRSLTCLDLFDECAATAESYTADEDQKQLLEELRANFVVL